ncbi:MAG TPA: hypothetical protein VM597_22635 [Gemmataceae bacterium]|nr:hypothetical protein [Gemmataceae bacterium]
MATVHVTTYEIERDRLPPVCVRCGAPADDRAVQSLYVIDGWRGAFQLTGLLLGVVFFPPLIRIVTRHVRTVSVRLPYCAPHYVEFDRRERLGERVFPIWTRAALVADGLMIADLLTGPAIGVCFTPIVASLGAVVGLLVVSRRRTAIDQWEKTGLRLSGVSEEFAAALLADRARDRVDNPDRRGDRGDIRDDYDDQLR